MKSNSISADCFLGDAGRFGFHAVHITSRMSPLTEHAQSNCSTVVSGIRTSRILSPGRMVLPTSLSSNTNPSDQSSSEVVKLQYTGRFDTSCQIRPSMVDISLTNTTGGRIVPPIADLTISSDASKQGWGASWDSNLTGGCWRKTDSQTISTYTTNSEQPSLHSSPFLQVRQTGSFSSTWTMPRQFRT